ncbi:MAG: M20/M25/M40 family metallo-hydrolase [Gemmatimonadetes bacterium]|nr:M20/M25/M40 family metallo-hydrolase [Gemmatimonadota bacterium]
MTTRSLPFSTLLPAASLAVALAASSGAPLQAQPAPRPMPGYTPAAAAAQRRAEAAAIAAPQPARAKANGAALAREPHVAGTPAQKRTADYVIDRMKALGLETELKRYDVWLPHATAVSVTKLGRDTAALDLVEPGVPGDSATLRPQYPTVNGSSGAGTGEGELVFANFGLIEDYATLDSLGVSVRGKVVLARYGRSFRGIKAREAEKRGAVALLIYTDPLDDGFVQGDVYPEGPMRPLQGVQRGSVFNGTGDPLTPGYASVPGAPRLRPEQAPIPRIPVVPISAANAQALMAEVRGTDIPRGWQGGMALRYHVGAGPVRVRVSVATDAATQGTKAIWNTLGIVRGSTWPDEFVYIGAHRDAWGPGAADNISGTVSVLEAAAAVAELAKAGQRPKRTVVFATWDAEEWGLVGSTEYVEDDSLRLKAGAVAYLNQDVSAQGAQFGGGGSPSLRAVLRDVVKDVPDPQGRGSVYQAWRATSGTRADTLEPPMGDPGGGSDFAGFYNHLGIPHADWGFGGPAGTYHSAYDTHAWMERFGDPGFQYHATAGRIGAAMALRLANADVLPYDYAEFARTMRRQVALLERGLAAKGWDAGRTAALVAPLVAAIDGLEGAATRFHAVRDGALARGASPEAQRGANAALRQVERALARPSGLKSRPWYRSLIYASDVDNGYSTMVFPGIGEAIRYGSEAEVRGEVAELAERFAAATREVERAAQALGGR